MATSKNGIKAKVKAKVAATKAKIKAKVAATKAKVKGCACAILASLLALGVVGCMDTAPASRATSTKIGDMKSPVDLVFKNSCSNTVTITVNTRVSDGAVASADSEGSTETQTATPTLDIRARIDARYNDAIAAASTASRSVLGSIGDGVSAVLDLMASKKSGKVAVTKSDGTPAVVECADGQCSYCEDCEYTE